MNDIRLKSLDAVWLMMDSNDTPMHVGVLAVFQKPKATADGYIAQLAEKLRSAQNIVAP